MRFDYLHDSVPDAIERFRSTRVTPHARAPISAIITALIVVLAASGIESYRMTQARAVERAAEARVEQSRAALAQTKLERIEVEKLLALDRRLRAIRLSGSLLSERLADIANHVPAHAWLTSLSSAQTGISISGRAEGLRILSDTIADLMSGRTVQSPMLVRAGKDERVDAPALLSFEMRMQEAAR